MVMDAQSVQQYEDSKGIFLQEYPEDDISCFLAGENLVLDSAALRTYISMVTPPITTFEEWDIWKAPQEGVPYIVSGDPSDGKYDYSAGTILDAISLEAVARYHDKTIASHFAKVLHTGAKMYGDAMIVVETPGPGQTVIDRLMLELAYTNMYYYTDDVTGYVKDDPGWPQNSKTRGIVIDTLQKLTKAKGYRVYDERTVRELAALTWRKVGNMRRARAEAAKGSHDDLVFSLALALCTAPEALRRWAATHQWVNKGGGKRVSMIGDTGPAPWDVHNDTDREGLRVQGSRVVGVGYYGY